MSSPLFLVPCLSVRAYHFQRMLSPLQRRMGSMTVLRSCMSTRAAGAAPKHLMDVRPAAEPIEPVFASEMEAMESKGGLRPMSPHLTIYAWQLTAVMSIGFRMTGAGLATLVYAAGISAAILPPSTLEMNSLVQSLYTSCPSALITFGKAMIVTPFLYHTFNGLRHLTWDLGYFLTLDGVYKSGWIVNGVTLLSTLLFLIL